MIPRRAFWCFDLIIFGLAFGFTAVLFPLIQSLLAASPLRVLTPAELSGKLPSYSELAWMFFVVATVGVVTIMAMDGHGSLMDQSLTRVVLTSLVASLAGLALLAMVFFGLRSPSWSRLFILSFVLLSGLGLVAYRTLVRTYCLARRRRGAYARNVVVAGSPNGIARALEGMQRAVVEGQFRVFGYLRLPHLGAEAYPAGIACCGTVEQLETLLIRSPIQHVVSVVPAQDAGWVNRLLADCDRVGVPLAAVPESLLEFSPSNLCFTSMDVSGLPAVTLRLPSWDSEAVFFKRCFDIVAAGAALLVLSPALLLIALIVKLSSPGPALYPWRVIGQHGQAFTGYKFRTMIDGADALKEHLMAFNEMDGPVFKMTNDPRVTKVGRFLRKFSLDELPQLFSVIKGDMSLVGPRPAGPRELERYDFWQMRKLSIRPGITCLWQVRGRNAIKNFSDWVQMDLEYIDSWSLWLDIKILLWTAKAVLAGTGK